MARYKEKDITDLRWNRVRRRLTRELDTQIQDWREEALNKLLSRAWQEYAASLNTGETLELEAEYEEWVGKALEASGVKPVLDEMA
jgi:hypothetical protein